MVMLYNQPMFTCHPLYLLLVEPPAQEIKRYLKKKNLQFFCFFPFIVSAFISNLSNSKVGLHIRNWFSPDRFLYVKHTQNNVQILERQSSKTRQTKTEVDILTLLARSASNTFFIEAEREKIRILILQEPLSWSIQCNVWQPFVSMYDLLLPSKLTTHQKHFREKVTDDTTTCFSPISH